MRKHDIGIRAALHLFCAKKKHAHNTLGTDTRLLHMDDGIAQLMRDDLKTTLTLWATYKCNMVRTKDGWKIKRHELVSRGTRIQTDQ